MFLRACVHALNMHGEGAASGGTKQWRDRTHEMQTTAPDPEEGIRHRGMSSSAEHKLPRPLVRSARVVGVRSVRCVLLPDAVALFVADLRGRGRYQAVWGHQAARASFVSLNQLVACTLHSDRSLGWRRYWPGRETFVCAGRQVCCTDCNP